MTRRAFGRIELRLSASDGLTSKGGAIGDGITSIRTHTHTIGIIATRTRQACHRFMLAPCKADASIHRTRITVITQRLPEIMYATRTAQHIPRTARHACSVRARTTRTALTVTHTLILTADTARGTACLRTTARHE